MTDTGLPTDNRFSGTTLDSATTPAAVSYTRHTWAVVALIGVNAVLAFTPLYTRELSFGFTGAMLIALIGLLIIQLIARFFTVRYVNRTKGLAGTLVNVAAFMIVGFVDPFIA